MASPSGTPQPPARPSTAQTPIEAPLAALERYREAILTELRAALEGLAGPPYDLMRYHLGWEDGLGRPEYSRGGKLLRPALCLLTCEAAGGGIDSALPAAAALELLHNFTLIHDDVEDSSADRHGRPTLWRLRSASQAINAGDGMFALAHVTLLKLSERGQPAERVLAAAQLLDGTTLRLCEGQHLDLTFAEQESISERDYVAMIEGKTAALLAASCAMGALLAGVTRQTVDGLHEFGRRLGLAFQVRDDFLGCWGDPSRTGKSSADDLREGKKSYPAVIALARASAPIRPALLDALNEAASGGDVDRAVSLLEELGARAACEDAARDHAGQAVRALQAIDLRAEQKETLAALARFAAERSS